MWFVRRPWAIFAFAVFGLALVVANFWGFVDSIARNDWRQLVSFVSLLLSLTVIANAVKIAQIGAEITELDRDIERYVDRSAHYIFSSTGKWRRVEIIINGQTHKGQISADGLDLGETFPKEALLALFVERLEARGWL